MFFKNFIKNFNAGRFATDLVFGQSYLAPEVYAQRANQFWYDYASKVTADNVVDLTAQILADFVYCKSLPNIFIYLKEIDAATKMEKQIAKVAETFKKAVDTRLAKNPILVTSEGIPVKMTEAMHNMNKGGGGKNILNSAKTLLEAEKTGLLSSFKEELDALKNCLWQPQI